jgi:hypothetical protein
VYNALSEGLRLTAAMAGRRSLNGPGVTRPGILGERYYLN